MSVPSEPRCWKLSCIIPHRRLGREFQLSYSAAMLMCGGSGISFGLSELQDIQQKLLNEHSSIKNVTLIWIVTNPSKLLSISLLDVKLAFPECLEPLVGWCHDIICLKGLSIHIRVFYTPTTQRNVQLSEKHRESRLSLSPGRPPMRKLFNSVLSPMEKKQEPL